MTSFSFKAISCVLILAFICGSCAHHALFQKRKYTRGIYVSAKKQSTTIRSKDLTENFDKNEKEISAGSLAMPKTQNAAAALAITKIYSDHRAFIAPGIKQAFSNKKQVPRLIKLLRGKTDQQRMFHQAHHKKAFDFIPGFLQVILGIVLGAILLYAVFWLLLAGFSAYSTTLTLKAFVIYVLLPLALAVFLVLNYFG